MKKVLAIALALVMALSCGVMAFAESETKESYVNAECGVCGSKLAAGETVEEHVAVCPGAPTQAPTAAPDNDSKNESYDNAVCGYCGSKLGAEELMVDHLKTCPKAQPSDKDYIDLTLKEVLGMIVDLAKSSMEQWGDVETIVNKIIDFFDGLLNGGALKSEVDGLVAELENLFAGFEIPGIDELINALKEKILSFYAPGTVVPTTEPAEVEDTGSAPVGIAVFAAVSVAAAAAFVCTKKKD